MNQINMTVLAAVMLLTLAACGQGNDSASETDATVDAAADAAGADRAEEADGEGAAAG